jgi:hypothetical protein
MLKKNKKIELRKIVKKRALKLGRAKTKSNARENVKNKIRKKRDLE